MPKLPAHVIDRINSHDWEAEEREMIAESDKAYHDMLATWRKARYATEERSRFLRSSQWFVVDGTGWERGPYTEERAEEYAQSLRRTRRMMLDNA